MVDMMLQGPLALLCVGEAEELYQCFMEPLHLPLGNKASRGSVRLGESDRKTTSGPLLKTLPRELAESCVEK